MVARIYDDNSVDIIDIPVKDERTFIDKQKGQIRFITVDKLPTVDYMQKAIYKFNNQLNCIEIDEVKTRCLWSVLKGKQASDLIYSKYPQSKQSSDLADKLYFENALKAKGVKTLEKTIVTKITAFNDGKTFDEILDGVADENKEAMAQLLKVGIRVSWVQACKSELKTAIAENREPVYPEFPEI